MSNTVFDDQLVLKNEHFVLRPLQQDDFEALYKAASDPEIWAGHPAKTRHQIEVFKPYFDNLLNGGGALVIVDPQLDEIVGCSRYYVAEDLPGSISIGFTFLIRKHWGGNSNFEVKKLMLDHAFQHFSEVWFHIAPDNIRSKKATSKLGAKHVYDSVLELGGAAESRSCYRLSAEDWDKVSGSAIVQESI